MEKDISKTHPSLKGKECSILTNQVNLDEEIIQRDDLGNITWNIDREDLKFKKGFYTEDVQKYTVDKQKLIKAIKQISELLDFQKEYDLQVIDYHTEPRINKLRIDKWLSWELGLEETADEEVENIKRLTKGL